MKRYISLFLALCMAFTLMTACGDRKSATEAQPKFLHLSSTTAQSTLNPYMSSAGVDTTAIGYIESTLYGNVLNPETGRGERMPILAAEKPIDVSGDGTVWQIKIRDTAKWHNGEPINADTFMYSFRMGLDPKLLNFSAGNLANGFITIKNAEAYYTQATTGVPVDWEDVGIKKIDDKTLEITLTEEYTVYEVMRHFSQSATYPVYEPLYEAGMNSDRTETTYGTEFDQVMSCGQFYLNTWLKGSEIEYLKNEDWPYADLIKVDGVVCRVVKDNNTRLQMFEAGELDSVGLNADGVEQYAEDPRFRVSTTSYIDHIDINYLNTEKPILANINFRKAIFYSIDRATIADLTTCRPANFLVAHSGVSFDDGTTFRELPMANEYLGDNYDYDPDLALEYFNKAMEEEGLDSLELTMVYANDKSAVKIMVEFLQEQWSKIFGADRFKLNLSGMPNAQAMDTKKSFKTNPNAYELAASRWSLAAGKENPIRFMEPYTSTFSRRNGAYCCTEADECFKLGKTAEVRKDPQRLAEVTAQMEKALLDSVTVVPVFEETDYSLTGDRLILPFEKEDPNLGWGLKYSDIALD